MDINNLFDGIAEAFRRYQQEIADLEGVSPNPAPTGLDPGKGRKKQRINWQQRRE